MEEMPALEQFYQRLSPDAGLAMIGIATRSSRPDRVLRAAQRVGVSYPVTLDLSGAAAAALGPVRATPYSVLIDPAGRIISRRTGTLDLRRLDQRVRSLAAVRARDAQQLF